MYVLIEGFPGSYMPCQMYLHIGKRVGSYGQTMQKAGSGLQKQWSIDPWYRNKRTFHVHGAHIGYPDCVHRRNVKISLSLFSMGTHVLLHSRMLIDYVTWQRGSLYCIIYHLGRVSLGATCFEHQIPTLGPLFRSRESMLIHVCA